MGECISNSRGAAMKVMIQLQLEFRLIDLTAFVVKDTPYVTAQGSFGDVWKCRYDSGQDDNFEVCLFQLH
jgi:hypothetical protein